MDGVAMRQIFFAATIVALVAAPPSFAADLPVKAPPAIAAAPVLFSWTGCYGGGHVGGVVSEDRTTNVLGNSIGFSSTGFVGGGQIGCDYQFAAGWVAGVEGRAAWSSLKNTHSGTVRNLVTGVTLPSQFTLGNDFLASATAPLSVLEARGIGDGETSNCGRPRSASASQPLRPFVICGTNRLCFA